MVTMNHAVRLGITIVIVGLTWVAGGAGAFGEQGSGHPGIDALDIFPYDAGDVDVWVRWSGRPQGEYSVVGVGDETLLMTHRKYEAATALGVAWHWTARTSLWAEGALQSSVRDTIVPFQGESTVTRDAFRRTVGTLGVQHRWNPPGRIDPRIGLSRSSDEEVSIDASVAFLTDPALASVQLVRTVRGGTKGTNTAERSGGTDAGVRIGLVVNDDLYVAFDVGYTWPTDRKKLGGARLATQWNWTVGDAENHNVGFQVALVQLGREWDVTFGVEWTGTFRRR